MPDLLAMPTWDEAARWYVEMVRDPQRGFNDLAAATALELLSDVRSALVLDLGCGEGHVARRMAVSGARVVGVDPTAELLDAARRQERDAPLGIEYQPGFAEDLGAYADDTFDAVVSVLAVHHVLGLDRALTEIHRVLKPRGRLCIVIPHPFTIHAGATWSEGVAPRRVMGSYLHEGAWSEAAGAHLTSVRQIGWYHRTLSTWVTSLAVTGFFTQRVVEPHGALSGRDDSGGPWALVPVLLAFAATAV